jgi:hypothetical protein
LLAHPPGCWRWRTVFRWCRSLLPDASASALRVRFAELSRSTRFARPPATGWDASGVASRGHEAFASTPSGVLAMEDRVPVVSLVVARRLRVCPSGPLRGAISFHSIRSTTGYRLGRLRRRAEGPGQSCAPSCALDGRKTLLYDPAMPLATVLKATSVGQLPLRDPA